jgi:hypothetical protein
MDNKFWAYASQFVGISMLGAGVGFVTCAAMPAMLASVAHVKQEGVADLVASLFQALQKGGEGVGPLLGGLLSGSMASTPVINCRQKTNPLGCSSGFQWASFLFGALLLLYAAVTYALMPFIPPPAAGAPAFVGAAQRGAKAGLLLNEGEGDLQEVRGPPPSYGTATGQSHPRSAPSATSST